LRAKSKSRNLASSSSELACAPRCWKTISPLFVEKGDDGGMIEAALAVGTVTDAERRGELAWGVVVRAQ
jgi:hypothetical protein